MSKLCVALFLPFQIASSENKAVYNTTKGG